MKCCNNEPNDKNKQEHKHKNHMSHIWMMALCCGAPFLILLALPLVGGLIPGARDAILKIVPFLCPILMLLMLPMMIGKSEENKGNNNYCENNEDILK